MQPTPAPVPTPAPAPAVPDPAPVQMIAVEGTWAKLVDDVARNPVRDVSILLFIIGAVIAMIRGVPISSLPAVPIVAGAAVQHDAPMIAGAVLERRSFTDRHKLQIHRALQRIARTGTPEERKAAAAALASEDATQLIEARVEAKTTGEAPGLLATGKLTDFLQWLMTNLPAIIAEVLKLLHIVP
jgi:hypothetical protein